MKNITLLFAFILMSTHFLSSKILTVPQEHSTIQSAIDAAQNSDTVLVSEGTYYENIKYKGKGIVVTSRYFITKDWQTVMNTIIDGSTAIDDNNASTVQFMNSEDSTAVLDGFTITGGRGTRYTMPFGSVNQFGAGIILNNSSATIRNNYIMNNNVLPAYGGGGGIGSMYSNPTIYNNVIASNSGGYGGGVLLDFSGGKVRNNIMSNNNTSIGDGGGIQIWQPSQYSAFVENNTIINNYSGASAGGISIAVVSVPVTVKNNIVWGNRQVDGGQNQITSPQYVSYSDVEDYASGTNISVFPQLQEGSFLPSPTSPCIDAGDPAILYNDVENPLNPGMALLPSGGSLRNDIGAYGGAFAKTFPSLNVGDIRVSSTTITITCPTGQIGSSGIVLLNLSSKNVIIDSVTLTNTSVFSLNKNFAGQVLGLFGSDSISVTFHPTGHAYYSDTISVFHKIPGKANPIKIVVSASSNSTPYLNKAIPNQTAYTGVLFTYPIPDSTFIDIDVGDTLTYQATGMPSWLSFNTQTHTFQGTPTQTVRLITIGITVNDLLLASASTTLRMAVVAPLTDVDNSPTSPTQYELRQNYPNPFNPTTNIRFEIVDLEFVSLKIFDVLGREVATLINKEKPKGNYNVTWDASHMPSGVYFYHLTTENFSQVKRMLLIK
jgi:hypothetical protein